MEYINEMRSWFFEISKIKNEWGEITTDATEIQKMVRKYYEKLYGNKLNKLEVKDKFLPKLNQEGMENLNRPITSNEIESVIKLPTNKNPRPHGFAGKFYQIYKKS